MDRRHFLLATIASAAPVKAEPRISEVRLDTYCFRVPHFYVAAVRDWEVDDWDLHISYYRRPTDSVQTDFPQEFKEKFAACGIRGNVIESKRLTLIMRTRMNQEEVMRCCERLGVG